MSSTGIVSGYLLKLNLLVLYYCIDSYVHVEHMHGNVMVLCDVTVARSLVYLMQ